MTRRLPALRVLLAVAVAIAFPVASATARATTTVRVTAMDLKFKLSAKVAPKGTVVFKVRNAGKLRHDFRIGGKTTPMLAPGKTATLRVVLKRAGKYRYLCTVPGHAAAGMRGMLTVR